MFKIYVLTLQKTLMKQVLLGHRKDQDHDRQANTEVTQEAALRM